MLYSRHLLIGCCVSLTLALAVACGDDGGTDTPDPSSMAGSDGQGGTGTPPLGGSGPMTNAGQPSSMAGDGSGGMASSAGGEAPAVGGAPMGMGGAGLAGEAAVGGAGPCSGTATACMDRDAMECGVGDGCALTGGTTPCTGDATKACGDADNASDCALIAGCHWMGAMGGSCEGDAVACTEISAKTQCDFQGCTWGTVAGLNCTGTATACAELTEQGACEAQPGCSFD